MKTKMFSAKFILNFNDMVTFREVIACAWTAGERGRAVEPVDGGSGAES